MPYKDPEIRRIKARHYTKIWRQRHLEQAREIGRTSYHRNRSTWRKQTKEIQAAYMRKWRKKNKEVQRAYWKVKAALKSRKIMRSSHCERCGIIGKVEAHHHKGYAEEFCLDVQWLCRPCHGLTKRKPL